MSLRKCSICSASSDKARRLDGIGSGSKPSQDAVVMASERDEPGGETAKAWRRHGERFRRPGSPAMMPPRRGKGIFGPMDCVARLPDSAAIGRYSLLATSQISPCHGRALAGFGP